MTRFRREIRNGKLYIDLRKIGTFSTEDDVYLAGLIAIACSESHAKHYLSFAARHDFGWNDKLLSTYILAGLMNQYSTRANGFISSGEWLCGVFASGPILSKEHLRILMSYVNPLVSNGMILNGVYKSGKSIWNHAPPTLKKLLDLLDTAAMRFREVQVYTPIAEPLDPHDSMKTLILLPLSEIQDKVRIVWH
jgi:hypothetical protein